MKETARALLHTQHPMSAENVGISLLRVEPLLCSQSLYEVSVHIPDISTSVAY